ncbi:MAG: hypothetical protein A2Z03_01860 [Chloroflexi bacterium RBG_16_56_8]|nr:MAG: hypothetical protein A2Z03_01860 [Chloroflexi bacterium RBG_16_56_8]
MLTALLLAHSMTLLIVAPVLGLYTLRQLTRIPAATRLRAFRLLGISALLSMGLGAFYWLPFISELPLVKMGAGIEAVRGFFQSPVHFLTSTSLIQTSPLYEYGSAPFALGLVAVVLGILAIVVALAAGKHYKQWGSIIFFGFVAVVAAVAMLSSSSELWQRIPLATMVQYPWRVSVLIYLGLAVVIGSLPIALSHITLPRFSRGLTITLLAIATIWTATANLSPQQVFVPTDGPTLGQLARFEEISGFVGTTTFGEYLPNTVKVADLMQPAADAPQAPISPNADIRLVRYDPTERLFEVRTAEPASISLRALYFPDWQAIIDDQSATTYASTPSGLVTVDVPAGNHRVSFLLVDTTSRKIGNLASSISALIVLGLSVWVFRKRESQARAVLVVLGLALVVVIPPALTAATARPPALQPMQTSVAPNLNLIGLRIDQARFESDTWHISNAPTRLNLQVYWQAKSPLEDQPFKWQLRDDHGRLWAEHAQRSRYGTGAPTGWVSNEIIADDYALPLNSSLPAGRYTLYTACGESQNTTAVTTITLERNSVPNTALTPIPNPLDVRMGDDLHLLGFEAPNRIQPETRFPFTLYWKVDKSVVNDFIGFVQVLDTSGAVVARLGYEGLQFAGLNPTSLWTPNQVVVDRRSLRLPKLRPGLYYWAVGMDRYPDHERLPVITRGESTTDDVAVFGEFKVPVNPFTSNPKYPLNTSLGRDIRLTGYDLTAIDPRGNLVASGNDGAPPYLLIGQGQALELVLYWQAVSKITTDYKVFVHIVDQNGKLVAQQDQFPDAWRYPTHIWDAGEYVRDSHLLSLNDLPAGGYRVQIGMYQAETGERLTPIESNGNELKDRQIEIGQIEITGR